MELLNNTNLQILERFRVSVGGNFVSYKAEAFTKKDGTVKRTDIVTIKNRGGREQILKGELTEGEIKMLGKFKGGEHVDCVCYIVNRSLIVANEFRAERQWFPVLVLNQVASVESASKPVNTIKKAKVYKEAKEILEQPPFKPSQDSEDFEEV